MPKFYFHVDDGVLDDPDFHGTELPDEEAARFEAVKAAAEMLKEFDGAVWRQRNPWRMHVTDEAQRLLFTLHFGVDVPTGPVRFVPEGSPRREP
jgi:hypothetical protein